MKRIFAQNFSVEDLRQLSRLDKTDFAGTTAETLFQRIAAEELQAWRFGPGILLTWIAERVLWVEGMAGDNMTLRSKELFDSVKELAASLGCSKIRCIVQNETLLKLYTQRLDYVPVGTILEASL